MYPCVIAFYVRSVLASLKSRMGVVPNADVFVASAACVDKALVHFGGQCFPWFMSYNRAMSKALDACGFCIKQSCYAGFATEYI